MDEVSEQIENIEEPLTKPKNIEMEKNINNIKVKPKRKNTVPQSEKQKANFEKARLKRLENVAKRKELKEIEMGKKYIESKNKITPEPENEPEPEPEIIYKIKKKPKKRIIYIQESDEEEEEIKPTRINRKPININTPEPEPDEDVDYSSFFR